MQLHNKCLIRIHRSASKFTYWTTCLLTLPMQHYFSVNKLWIKPLRWNEGLDHLIWAVKWEVWFKSGQNTNLKGISFCFGYNHSFSKPLCTTQKPLVLSLLRTLYTQGHTLINNNFNVKTFMKATGSPFHFKRQSKVCFYAVWRHQTTKQLLSSGCDILQYICSTLP